MSKQSEKYPEKYIDWRNHEVKFLYEYEVELYRPLDDNVA